MKFEIIKNVRYLARDSSGSLFGYKEKPKKLTYPNGEHIWSVANSGFAIFIRERNDSLEFIGLEEEPWTVDIIEDFIHYVILHVHNKDRSVAISKVGNEISVIEGYVLEVVPSEETDDHKEMSDKSWILIKFLRKILKFIKETTTRKKKEK